MARTLAAAAILICLGSFAEASLTSATLKAAGVTLKASLREIAEATAKASKAFLADKPVKAAVPDSEIQALRQKVAGELRGEAMKEGLKAPHDPVNELQAARDAAALLQQGCEGCTPDNPGPKDLLHIETIKVVAEKLNIRDPQEVKQLIDLYGRRVRPAGQPKTEQQVQLEAEAAQRLLQTRRLSPDASKELMSRVTAMAGNFKPQGIMEGLPGGPSGAFGTVTAEAAAFQAAQAPRHQLPSSLSRRTLDVTAPQVGRTPVSQPLTGKGVVDRGIENLQAAQMIPDDGTLTTWGKKNGKMAAGIGQVVWGKVTDGKTYSDWWSDAKSVGRSFTAADDYYGWKTIGPAAWEGGKAIAGSIWEDFKKVGSTGVEYAKSPTSSKGADLTASVFMAGTNLLGLGAPGAIKGTVQTTVKAGVKEVVEAEAKTAVKTVVKEAAQASVKEVAKTSDNGAAKLAMAAGVSAGDHAGFNAWMKKVMPDRDPANLTPVERKVLESQYLKKTAQAQNPPPTSQVETPKVESAAPEVQTLLPGAETVRGRMFRDYAAKQGADPEALEKAFREHIKEAGFSAKTYDGMPPQVQASQYKQILASDAFQARMPKSAAPSPTLTPEFNKKIAEEAQHAFRYGAEGKGVMMRGSELVDTPLYRHIGPDEFSRMLKEGGLIPKAFKEPGGDFQKVLRESGGVTGLVEKRVLDNPQAKAWVYEFTEHAERSGLGATVSTAGPIKIQIVPKPNQAFVSTGAMSQKAWGRAERGWATMDVMTLDQIKIFGKGCEAGCFLSTPAGQELAKALLK